MSAATMTPATTSRDEMLHSRVVGGVARFVRWSPLTSVAAVLLIVPIVLAVLLMAGLGAGITTVIVAIAVTRIPGSSRIIRSVALSVKALTYVDAARVVGASHWRIMLRHIAPQCIAALLVVFSLNLGAAIF